MECNNNQDIYHNVQIMFKDRKIDIHKVNKLLYKQAENGLQSRSSENGKTAVWHCRLKLQ